MNNDLSPDRPWEEEEPALNPNPNDYSLKKFGDTWMGRLLWGGAFVIVVVIGVSLFLNRDQGPCKIAEEAYGLATTLDNQDGREIAALQYAAKSAECESQGGTVRQ